MPPKVKYTKESITYAALALVRECGASALNARSLAARLGTSTQPIFSNFSSMEEVKTELVCAASNMYAEYWKKEMESGKYPPYKCGGIAYIRFAKEERELFKLMFMRDRSGETDKGHDEFTEAIYALMKGIGLDEETAKVFHFEMWALVHGIAVMSATSYFELDDESVSTVLTDVYSALLLKYKIKGE